MSSDEQATLDLLLKKQKEESSGNVLQFLPGGGEKNAMADKLSEFATMARRGELFDYAIAVVKADGTTVSCAWGSTIPSLQICGAVGALNLHVLAALQKRL